MFKKILIANRGEIACRIIKTCRAMGVKTVAVFSEADREALHVKEADEAVFIGAAPASESYLDSKKIIAVAKKTDADAIHPGYGFLSENAAFAKACAKENIIFIGPPPKAIEAMGDKAKAKAIMEKAGVPLVPGAYGVGKAELKKAADKIGYPVLLKAVAGGGGKGMRVVEKANDFDNAYDAAQREGKSSFGNGEVMVEKYLAKPRHVEVQIFADSHGNTVHLFERDCSLQRRHQKVVEEAPAPNLPEAMRKKITKAAVKAAEAVGYVGAGTVEFLVEGKNFYFMEMNTRLQVEHPVTEAVTDIDLVTLQLETAAGQDQLYKQDDIFMEGHAIEVRLYAEVPAQGFMPATGTLLYLNLPEGMPCVRVDTGVVAGDTVTHFYDPMLAKIIAWGETRADAVTHLLEALAATQIVGVETNLAYLEAVVSHPDFRAGKVHTKLLEREQNTLLKEQKTPEAALVLAALYMAERQNNTPLIKTDDPFTPWQNGRGWRLGRAAKQEFLFEEGAVTLRAAAGGWEVNDNACAVADLYGDTLEAAFDSETYQATVVDDGERIHIFTNSFRAAVTPRNTLYEAQDAEVSGDLVAPLPGKVVKVLVKKGAKVKKGDDLMLIEAMKTEHHITAPADGKVTAVRFRVGDNVDKDQVLIDFTPEEES